MSSNVPNRLKFHKISTKDRGFIKFLCRRSLGIFSWAFLVFLMKESKKRRQKQPGKLMAKSCSQPVNSPGKPLMNPLERPIVYKNFKKWISKI